MLVWTSGNSPSNHPIYLGKYRDRFHLSLHIRAWQNRIFSRVHVSHAYWIDVPRLWFDARNASTASRSRHRSFQTQSVAADRWSDFNLCANSSDGLGHTWHCAAGQPATRTCNLRHLFCSSFLLDISKYFALSFCVLIFSARPSHYYFHASNV